MCFIDVKNQKYIYFKSQYSLEVVIIENQKCIEHMRSLNIDNQEKI